MNKLIKYYHALPHFLKLLVVSIYGIRLKRFRYGKETFNYIKKAKSRESFSPSDWRNWHDIKLKSFLIKASLEVPFYKDFWGEDAGSKVVEDLKNWPILSKEDVKNNTKKFVSDRYNLNSLSSFYTSGSTGTPLQVFFNKKVIRNWYALFELRWRNWHGKKLNDRYALIGGKEIVNASNTKPPYWVMNYGMNQLYMSAYHISQSSAEAYINAMSKYKVTYIYTYTSAIYSLAKFCSEKRIKTPDISFIMTNAEPVYRHQRQLIEKVFNCKVVETYGMAEMLVGAGQCSYGNMHYWPDAGIIETEHGSEQGEIILTGLVNDVMPLIRYKVGDNILLDENTKCECGRTLPIVKEIIGRTDDILLAKDGKEIGRMDTIFKSDIRINEAQIIQKHLDYFELNIVPSINFSPSDENIIRNEMKKKFGDVTLVINYKDEIKRGPNGKFKSVISELNK